MQQASGSFSPLRLSSVPPECGSLNSVVRTIGQQKRPTCLNSDTQLFVVLGFKDAQGNWNECSLQPLLCFSPQFASQLFCAHRMRVALVVCLALAAVALAAKSEVN